MPADVESMMYEGAVPWHGIGKQVLEAQRSQDAIVIAGLDWDVETAPIVSADHKRTAVDDYRITRRMTDNCVLGVVKKSFCPIQNRDAFKLFDTVVGEKRAVYHTAGSLQGGSKVFIVAKMPEVMEIGKSIGSVDEVERYLLLSNAHDGTRPLQMIVTPVRVVCSNTLALALSKESEDDVTAMAPRISIRHTRWSIDSGTKEATRIMKAAYKYYETFGNFSEFLYRRQLKSEQVSQIVSTVFPPNKKMEVTPAIANYRAQVIRLFDEGKGHDRPGVRGSAWAMLNAFTEYADHKYALKGAKEAQDRSYSVLMGGAKGLKNRATKIMAQLVAA